MERHRFTVDPESAGTRLDVYLAGLLPQHSRSQLQRLVKGGSATLCGRPAKANAIVKGGDIVEIDVPDATPATPVAQDIDLPVIYQDDDVIVVNKPAGMVVHPAAGHDQDTLVNALLFHADNLSGVGGEQRPGIVHRLDRGTSGLMVAAKNDLAHRELTRQFHDREVEKEYLALAWGEVHAGVGSTCRWDATRCIARRCPRARAGPAPPSRASPDRATCTASAC
jgi:23S rRNA pseudouridine1911/1915/1917 synthase